MLLAMSSSARWPGRPCRASPRRWKRSLDGLLAGEEGAAACCAARPAYRPAGRDVRPWPRGRPAGCRRWRAGRRRCARSMAASSCVTRSRSRSALRADSTISAGGGARCSNGCRWLRANVLLDDHVRVGAAGAERGDAGDARQSADPPPQLGAASRPASAATTNGLSAKSMFGFSASAVQRGHQLAVLASAAAPWSGRRCRPRSRSGRCSIFTEPMAQKPVSGVSRAEGLAAGPRSRSGRRAWCRCRAPRRS